jgi:hypothetical protein
MPVYTSPFAFITLTALIFGIQFSTRKTFASSIGNDISAAAGRGAYLYLPVRRDAAQRFLGLIASGCPTLCQKLR